jgi:alpha,alpha-trehalose phosphorylase
VPLRPAGLETAETRGAGRALSQPRATRNALQARRGRRARPSRGRGRGVIQHPGFEADSWTVRETAPDLESLAQTESLFALANGHLGLRANLDEGEPSGQPGTYLAGFAETRPLPYAEPGYGDPEDGQTVVSVTNGKILRLSVEDEPFDVRYGELRKHERILDLRAGVLRRTIEWASPTGRLVRIASTRIVSFTHRSIAAILYEVEPLDDAAQVVVQSELITNEAQPTTHAPRRRSPRRWPQRPSTVKTFGRSCSTPRR